MSLQPLVPNLQPTTKIVPPITTQPRPPQGFRSLTPPLVPPLSNVTPSRTPTSYPPLPPSEMFSVAGPGVRLEDSLQPVQAPDLLDLLLQEFRAAVERENLVRQTQGLEPVPPSSLTSPAAPLLDFCKEYLARFRPVEVFAVDRNYGVMLSNGRRFVISPRDEDHDELPRGMLPDAGAVAMTDPDAGQESRNPSSLYRF